MGRTIDKIRQVFNLFLIMLLVAAVAAVFIYFLSTPEGRGTTFWMSVGFLAVALVLTTLFAARVAWRGNSGRDVPGNFAQLFLVGGYFIFVIAVSIWNARSPFSATGYLLTHVAGLAVFMLPLVLTNMAMLKQSDSTRREQRQGRQNLAARATLVRNVAEDLGRVVPAGELAPLRKLADALQYSDPSPASQKLEDTLDDTLKALKVAANKVTDSDAVDSFRDVLKVCALAGRALEARNAEILNSK